MNSDSLLSQDWLRIVFRLGGAASLASTSRLCKAFLRPRGIRNAVDLLRIMLAYCLGERGLSATAAWAAAAGLADVSNPAILYRLRHCGDWLTVLIGQLLTATTPTPAQEACPREGARGVALLVAVAFRGSFRGGLHGNTPYRVGM